MYAWRARVGVILPTLRGKAIAFWYDNRPDGVEIVPAVIGFRNSSQDAFVEGPDRAAELAAELKELGCSVISVSGTPPFLLRGAHFEQNWGREVSERLGLPVLTPTEAHASALKAMGVKTLALASYFGDELNSALVHYLGAHGLTTHVLGGYGEAGREEGLLSTSLAAIDDVSYVQVYQYCKSRLAALDAPVDALYIAGAGWDAAPAVHELETDLGLKVVFAQAAEMWLAYQNISVSNPIPRAGALLRESYRPLADT